MEHDEVEIALWEYIDGVCSDAEQQRISTLVREDTQWKQKYTELLALHEGLGAALEIEEPSMRFTQNVMDIVGTAQIGKATGKYIDKRIIRAIAAFFIISIGAVLGYGLFTADWSTPGNSLPFKLNLDKVTGFFNSNVTNAIVIINIFLALVLADLFFRKRRNAID